MSSLDVDSHVSTAYRQSSSGDVVDLLPFTLYNM